MWANPAPMHYFHITIYYPTLMHHTGYINSHISY